jgi:hypothetical protein
MRRFLFAALLVPLAAVLLLVGSHRAGLTPPRRPATTTVAARRAASGHPPTGARPQVRRFIAAFLSYEVGVDRPAVKAAIRGCASRRFARQLLSDPPMPSGRPGHGAAGISSLHIDPMPGHRDLAFVSGEARRADGPEPFSFIFARRVGRWLAVAPGE